MYKMYKIILTVPHSICFKGSTRLEKNCDLSALKFANILHTNLNDVGYNSTIIKPINHNRFYLDPNRFFTKSEKYGYLTIKDSDLWKNLNKEISNYKDYDNIVVLDIHSFPMGSFGVKKDIVILDNVPYQKITRNLNTFLKETTHDSVIIPAGTGNNAIIDVLTSGPVYIKTLLIEINENLSVEELHEIAKSFVTFLKINKHHEEYSKNKNDYLKLNS
jgi:hypothetical protein